MSSDRTDDRSIEERCRVMSTAIAVRGTISLQATMRAPEGPALDDPPASLPHISLVTNAVEPTASSGLARWPTTDAPDLEVVGVIGEGGMGRVLAARQRSLRRDVAVKTLRQEAATQASTLALLREGVITGALEHPSIVPIHAVGCDDRGRPVLVMKRIEGVAWSTLLDDPHHPAWKKLDGEGGEPLEAHLEILSSVCNALHFAHKRGIVHRDVKPENVMVGEFGEVYLVDWGIAARTGTAIEGVVGTPCFLAPEMVRGAPVDERTDVYLLGATLHRVLTGVPRHDGTTLESVLISAAHSRPVTYDAAVPEELAALCNAATHVDPRSRPESALVFRKALADHLRHRGAISLSHAAEKILAEAQALRRTPNADAAVALRRLTEARFGFRQALREWPEGASARRGLGACLEEMIDLELAQGDEAGARALLDELPEPRPALAARIAEHEAQTREEREHDARLRAMEREMDPAVARGARLGTILVGSFAILAISLYAILRRGKLLDGRDALEIAIVVTGLLLFVTATLHRRVLRSGYNRRLFGLTAIACVSLLAGRTLGLVHGTPVDVTLTHDMISFAVIGAVGAFTVARWLAWPAAFYGISTVVSMLVPSSAPILFSAFALLAVFAGVIALWRSRRSVDEAP